MQHHGSSTSHRASGMTSVIVIPVLYLDGAVHVAVALRSLQWGRAANPNREFRMTTAVLTIIRIRITAAELWATAPSNNQHAPCIRHFLRNPKQDDGEVARGA